MATYFIEALNGHVEMVPNIWNPKKRILVYKGIRFELRCMHVEFDNNYWGDYTLYIDHQIYAYTPWRKKPFKFTVRINHGLYFDLWGYSTENQYMEENGIEDIDTSSPEYNEYMSDDFTDVYLELIQDWFEDGNYTEEIWDGFIEFISDSPYCKRLGELDAA